MRTPTIYDVAQAAGVAASTVSRTFGVPGRVSESTRQRVHAAAEELGYQPNPHARALRDGRRGTFALVLSDITNPHFFKFIRGAEQRAKAADHTLVIVNGEESPRIEHKQIDRLLRSVDGFVLASSRLADDNLRTLGQRHRVVLLNRELPPLQSVSTDTQDGCRQILEHLASLGHRELTYCAGPPTSWMGAARWAALSAGAADLGLVAHRVGPYTPTVANGAPAADGALRTGATAFVAHNDLLAIGVMRRLNDRGVRVPEDVSIVGFDDIFASEFVGPGLTSLANRGAHAGRLSVEVLLGPRDEPADLTQLRLPTSLVVRGSSGPAP